MPRFDWLALTTSGCWLCKDGTTASKTTTSSSATATTLSRPSPSSAPKPVITSSSSRASITSAVTSSKTDAGAIAKKRKVEDPQSSLDMLRQRAALLAKAKKEKATSGSTTVTPTSTNKPPISKISTASARPATTSAGNTPTEAVKKPGYKELLARAAQAQAEMKSAPGTITHKARPQVKEQRAWQKKLEEKKAGKVGANGNERSSKSPGITSGGEKGSAAGKKTTEPIKTVAGKKGVGGVDSRRSSLGNVNGTAAKGKVADKGRNGSTGDTGIKRKRESPPRGGYGASGRGGSGYTLPKKNMSRRYDTYEEEDEDDDFVVDDEDDVPARGPRYSGGGGKKYVIHYRRQSFLFLL